MLINNLLYCLRPSLLSRQIKLYVNKLTSTKTQMPFDYYSLPFCHPTKIQVRGTGIRVKILQRHVSADIPAEYVFDALQGESENLGEVLSGDRIEKNSLYEVRG